MKVLIFEGAGWEKADSSIKSGVGNCRIRTRIRNNNGRVIYLEMGGTEVNKKTSHKNWIGYNYGFSGHVDHCFYADSKWDSNKSYSYSLKEIEHMHFEYSKENILNFVNENLNCSFDELIVINDNSVRVHDTTEPLCDCSSGNYIPYKDPEYNINLLDGVMQLNKYTRGNFAQYEVGYDFVKEHKSLKRWIESRDIQQQLKYPHYNYRVSLRWDENGFITSMELTARQSDFCYIGLGIESVEHVINEIKRFSKELITV